MLANSPSVLGVDSIKRQPIANETRVRGQHLGETLTWSDGVSWFPARQDLDTFLSKIDSGVVRDAIVLKGPYSARYGPGFSFIDIETDPTPRYHDGFEWHGRMLFDYKFNAEQINTRASLWGGGDNWGARISYGHRLGNDYETGGDVSVPTRYNTGDVDFAFGYDLTPKDHLEFGYMRLDQSGLFFPGQIFDVDILTTYGFRLRYSSEDKAIYDRLVVDSWYNRTTLNGDAQHSFHMVGGQLVFTEKRQFIPQLGMLGTNFIATTDIDQASTGYRIAMSWGGGTAEHKEPELTVGQDLRFLQGALNENDVFGGPINLPCAPTQNFPIPPSHQLTIGFFTEYSHPVNDCFTVKVGARGDYVNSDIDHIPPGFPECPGTDFVTIANQDFFGPGPIRTSNFERDLGVWLTYGTAEYKLSPYWTILGGSAHAERPPTQTELYAMGPFLAVLQQGFTNVIGNPTLASEKLSQIDLGLKGDYGWVRTGVNGYYGLVQDYITFMPLSQQTQGSFKLPASFTQGLTVQYVNTGLATLAGFEFYGEVDVSDWLTAFTTMSYVEGRDLNRGDRPPGPLAGPTIASQEPLPSIPPLETRVGLRFHEPVRSPLYGLEFAARLVAPQHQVASSLGETPSAGFTVFDLRGYWQIKRGSRSLLLTAGVENLFDNNYREHLDPRTGVPLGIGVFQPGINPYLGVEYRW